MFKAEDEPTSKLRNRDKDCMMAVGQRAWERMSAGRCERAEGQGRKGAEEYEVEGKSRPETDC